MLMNSASYNPEPFMKASALRIKTIAFLLALAVALSIVIESSHQHGDAAPHPDCPICAAGAVDIDGSWITTPVACIPNASYLPFCENSLNPIRALHRAVPYRGPPPALPA
jgi:hypothetical protein